MQSDELARLRARMLTEAGEKRDTDVALEDLQAAMTGLQGLTEAQKAELRRLQALTESLQARAVRPRTPHMKLDVMIQGDATVSSGTGGGRHAAAVRRERAQPARRPWLQPVVRDAGA